MLNNTDIFGKEVNRVISVVIGADGFVMLNRKKLIVSGSSIKIYPEFLAYAVGLEGCPLKLILYILFHKIDLVTCRLLINDQVIKEFKDYISVVESTKKYKKDVVKQALRKLVEANLLQSVKRGFYMVNPMVIAKDSALRRTLISEYSKILFEKGNDVEADFFPKYN
jgi:hypothetical protein